jgi:hypothetical protein
MPKEITHWKIAEAVQKSLAGTDIGSVLQQNSNCCKLGAVFYDSLYYVLPFSSKHPVYELPDLWHGKDGKDTFEPLNRMLGRLEDSDNRAHLALLIGIYSHIAADIAFHPFINYFSGDYFSRDKRVKATAIKAHRRFECVLDLFLCREFRDIRNYSLKSFLENIEVEVERLLEFVDIAGGGISREVFISKAGTSLNLFSRVQHFGLCSPIFALTYRMERWLPLAFGLYNALFHAPQLFELTKKLSGKISFRNPYSGDTCCSSVQDIFSEAVEDTVSFCRMLEPGLETGAYARIERRGSSLATGLHPGNKSQELYFASEPLFDP